jgi:hypothetical protein
MAQELPVPGRARAPRLPENGGNRAEDSSEGHEEEVLGGRGEKSPPQAAQPGSSGLSLYLSVLGLGWGLPLCWGPSWLPLKMFTYSFVYSVIFLFYF